MLSRRQALAAGVALIAARSAVAQAAYPDRPIRVIVPFAAGGNADIIGRVLQPRLQEKLGQPVVVENRPGAGGSVGAEAVARARPDGYTLLIGSNGPLSVNPVVQARLPYDATRDFAPVAMAMEVPHCLVVRADAPYRTVADVVAASRAAGGEALGIGTAGVASATHLSLESFKAATGARLLHVPYRGGGAAVPDFLAGNLPMLFTELSTGIAMQRDGKGRVIAIASPRRVAELPDVPTMIEQGVPDFTAGSYVGLLAPTGTPPEAMRRLSQAMAEIVAEPDFRARMQQLGGEAASGALVTPEGFANYIAQDLAKSRNAARIADIKPE
ncbi:tripartite tricarboxylate transporter substrate binding protein [Roseomonas terrae]|uniref:Tripartite tricarboxylate transporter substrate binding protein n=1 Tax=Neoroseomonas terrae TaxID=424799 RepID=A0ABS5EEM6_9PROT|nr:tripartite tricarboxylate transporter substrate binding protein [Neoroseomonas terrae]MBR0649415.1 tripartite tricarboxylate transporter substrate binding protein [Neoroseomonas terrae]